MPTADVVQLTQSLFPKQKIEIEYNGLPKRSGVPEVYVITTPSGMFGAGVTQVALYDPFYQFAQANDLSQRKALFLQHISEFPRAHLTKEELLDPMINQLLELFESKEFKSQLSAAVHNGQKLDINKVASACQWLPLILLELRKLAQIPLYGPSFFNNINEQKIIMNKVAQYFKKINPNVEDLENKIKQLWENNGFRQALV